MLDSYNINPWLAEVVAHFRKRRPDDGLRESYLERVKEGLKASWEEYIAVRALRDALLREPYLMLHRVDMDLPEREKDLLNKLYVDNLADLLQFTVEELRSVQRFEPAVIDIIINYLSKIGYSLCYSPELTYKIKPLPLPDESALSPAMDFLLTPERLQFFNVYRPSVSPYWFDEYYRQYEYYVGEEEFQGTFKDLSMVYDEDKLPGECYDFFSSLSKLWSSYEMLVRRYKWKNPLPRPHLPEENEIKDYPVPGYIDLKKDAARAVIYVLERLGKVGSLPAGDYLSADDDGKLDVLDELKDETLKEFLSSAFEVRIVFEGIQISLILIAERPLKFDLSVKDSPLTPEISDAVMKFRQSHTDEALRRLYKEYLEDNPGDSWREFIISSSLKNKSTLF